MESSTHFFIAVLDFLLLLLIHHFGVDDILLGARAVGLGAGTVGATVR